MILLKAGLKKNSLNTFLLLFCLTFITHFEAQAKGFFPTETPTGQTTTLEKKKTKKVKKWRKSIKKWKGKVRSKNLFGKASFYTFIAASILNFTVAPMYLAGVVSVLFLASFLTAIIGSFGGDVNRKKAKMMLLIHGLIFTIIFGWLGILLIG